MTAVALLILAAQDHAQHDQHKMHQQMSKGDHMHRRFDDPAQWAKSFDDPARDSWQMPDKILADLKITSKMTVADIGAGTGYLSTKLATQAGKVLASDIEASMVAYLKERAARAGLKNITAVQASETSPNLPEKADLIVVLNTYHHIPSREAYFKNLAASIKKGGRLAIIDWRPEAKMGPPKEFKFTPAQIASELGKAGYKKLEQFDYLPEQNFLIFTR
jgi:2-polyprenyl-3-methyl-5-hydroxy-6-metoxy-1,4-benzoquinol methylase